MHPFPYEPKKKMPLNLRIFTVCCGLLCLPILVRAQPVASNELPDAPAAQQDAPQTNAPQERSDPTEPERRGIRRILPNYSSVSASVRLPPMTAGEKFEKATKDSFSPSVILVRGAIAGINQARDATPEFHQGAAGYGRYFWHGYADAAVETMMVEFIVPTLVRQDPRYYRLGSGGFAKRTGYSLSRVVVTRTDGGRNTFNVSEVAGAGAAAGISDLYYPRRDRTFGHAMEAGGLNVAIDAATFMVREFWPEINHAVFRAPRAGTTTSH